MAARLAGRSLYKGMVGRYGVICARTENHPEIPISSRRSEDKELFSSPQRFGSLLSVSFPACEDALSPFFFVNRILSFPVRADVSVKYFGGWQASYPRFSAIPEGESPLNTTPGDLRLPKLVEASEWVKKLFGIWEKLICGPESENVEVFPYLVPGMTMTDEEFFEFCHMNSEYQLERTAQGGLLMMSPAGMDSGWKNSELNAQLRNWNVQNGTGITFDSSTGFTLPNGAIRSADAAWVSISRYKAVPLEQQDRYAPICPEFVIELRSRTDRLGAVKAKMEEYIQNGTALGWLIDPLKKQVYVYQPNTVTQIVESPTTLSADPILPGFVLDLSTVWKQYYER